MPQYPLTVPSRSWYGTANTDENSITPIFNDDTEIANFTHPEYDQYINRWHKYRLTYEGGKPFLEEYLQKFSEREDPWDFKNRKKISHVPAFAKASVNEIKNSIFQRMGDITRTGGSPSYMLAVAGKDKGVDREDRTMNNFIGAQVLPELLSMGKVGVFVDMPSDVGRTQIEQMGKNPYLYIYKAEDIRDWVYDTKSSPREFLTLLVRDWIEVKDETTGLPTGIVDQYKLFQKTSEGVQVTIFDKNSKQIGESVLLKINRIPMVIFELSESLLTDASDYQISLLNLASADMNYSFKSNFPFYTEQFDPRRISNHIRQNYGGYKETGDLNQDGTIGTHEPGTAAAAAISKPQEIVTGATKGRRYPLGTERPAYIHPSSEPLAISMDKQEQLKRDIKLLVNLSVSNLVPARQASAESKALDEQSLEAGLSYIGIELEYGESRIAVFWAMYENTKKIATVKYPTNYSLKSDEDRLKESKELSELRADVASTTYQKEVSKIIANTLLSDRVDVKTIQKVYEEIDKSKIPVTDAETIAKDIEQGLLSVQTASEAKGYPEGEVEKAKEEHAERAARIVRAQTKAAELKNPAARGVDDLSTLDEPEGRQEKDASQKNKDGDIDIKDKTRGKAK